MRYLRRKRWWQAFDILSDSELIVIEKNVGQLFHFNEANPTGHYKLQLGNRFDRQIACRIAEIAAEQTYARRTANMVDTSQKVSGCFLSDKLCVYTCTTHLTGRGLKGRHG
jgi:hypothetical protein